MVHSGPPEIVEELERGDVVDPARYYLRTIPLLATAEVQYDGINRLVTLGIGHRPADGPICRFLQALRATQP